MDKLVEVHFLRRYRQVPRTCPYCGTTFEAPVLRRYCSEKCKRNAAWHRNGARYREALRARKEKAS